MPSRYNLRKRNTNTTWVKDETLKAESDSDSSEDEDFEPDVDEEDDDDEEEDEEDEEEEESEEEDVPIIKLPKGSKVSVRLHIHTVTDGKAQLHICLLYTSDAADE